MQTEEMLSYEDGNKGILNAIKIAGCELWLRIIDKFYQSKSFYLVGAKPEVL